MFVRKGDISLERFNTFQVDKNMLEVGNEDNIFQ